jgi:predicted RNase H-like HicB family nuclease
MPVIPTYSYRVFWSADDQEFVATCVEIPGLSGLAATEAGAIDELKVAIGGWLEHLTEQGIAWPEPNPDAFSEKADMLAHPASDTPQG